MSYNSTIIYMHARPQYISEPWRCSLVPGRLQDPQNLPLSLYICLVTKSQIRSLLVHACAHGCNEGVIKMIIMVAKVFVTYIKGIVITLYVGQVGIHIKNKVYNL